MRSRIIDVEVTSWPSDDEASNDNRSPKKNMTNSQSYVRRIIVVDKDMHSRQNNQVLLLLLLLVCLTHFVIEDGRVF